MDQQRSFQGKFSSAGKLLLSFFFLLLAILPIGRIIFELSRGVAHNPSNDELMIVETIGNIVGGRYSWVHFPRDVFLNGHFEFFPTLLHVFLAKFLAWNLKSALYLGLLLTLSKLLFLFLSLNTGRRSLLLSSFLALALSLLVLSPSQISSLEFEFVGIQMGLTYLGVATGIWATIHITDRRRSLPLMILMGFLASWSFGGGILIWPIYLLGMALMGNRRGWQYASIAVWSVLSFFPYLYFLKIRPMTGLYSLVEQKSSEVRISGVSFFNYKMLISGLGWPLSQSFDPETAWKRGWVGLCLAVIAIIRLATAKEKIKDKPATVAGLLFMLFGILSVWQISIFRDNIAPWYADPFMFFWIGLLGISVDELTLALKRNTIRSGLGFLASIPALSVLLYFYGTSNLSFESYRHYIFTRSPAAESCLRNFEIAPTYCEQRLFLWPAGQYWLIQKLAWPLKRFGLSIFSREQDWTLQGDYMFDEVKLDEKMGVPAIWWSADLGVEAVTFTDYRALNLFVHTPNSVEWEVTLPENIDSAEFRSAVAMSSAAPISEEADGLTAQVSLTAKGKSGIVFSRHLEPGESRWNEFTVPLNAFKGQAITLKLSSEGENNNIHDWLMFRFPYIHLRLRGDGKAQAMALATPVRPQNVDVLTDGESSGDGFEFPLDEKGAWNFEGFAGNHSFDPKGARWPIVSDPSIKFLNGIEACIGSSSKFRIKMSLSKEVSLRIIQVIMRLDDPNNPVRSFFLPLIDGEEEHVYDFDLKLLETLGPRRLTGLTIKPMIQEKFFNEAWMKISDIHLVGLEPQGACK